MVGCKAQRWGWLAVGLLGSIAFVSPAVSADDAPVQIKTTPLDPIRTRAEADAAQRDGKWEKALDLYLRLYFQDRSQPDLRDQIRFCLRHASQTNRLRDPAFQHFMVSLPPTLALDVYFDGISKLTSLYADRDRATTGKLFALGLDELDRAISSEPFQKRHLEGRDPVQIQKFQQSLRDVWRTRLPSNPREARQAARELVAAAQKQAGIRNPSAVVLELMCGACSGLDEYTTFLSPTGSGSDASSSIVEMLAYGLLVSTTDGILTIEGVVPGSWAATSTSLRKGDRITRVNGKVVQPATKAALAEALRAAQATGHELEVPAGMGPPALVNLPIPVPTVLGADIVNGKDGIGYLRITSFREHTPAEVDRAVTMLKNREMRALVIDLRGNFGGHFMTAVHLAQRFVPTGVLATTHGQLPDFDEHLFSSESGVTAYDFPVVLMVDTRTMSSAEIFTAALKDHGRATVIGVGTFGKGAIQCPFRIDPSKRPETIGRDLGTLVITVATVSSPRGQPINGSGVTPHVIESDPARQLELAIAKALVALATEGR